MIKQKINDNVDFLISNFSKPYDMTMINEPEDCKTVRDRFDGSKSNEATDIELEPVGSIPTTDLSDSDDEVVNEVNDDSSLGMYKQVWLWFDKQKKNQEKQTNCVVVFFQFQFLQSKSILF